MRMSSLVRMMIATLIALGLVQAAFPAAPARAQAIGDVQVFVLSTNGSHEVVGRTVIVTGEAREDPESGEPVAGTAGACVVGADQQCTIV